MGDEPERFGRYRVLRALGSGAMGSVYLASDELLGREVADANGVTLPFGTPRHA